MNRKQAKKVNEDTRKIVKDLENRYEFVTETYLQNVRDGKLGVDDIIQLVGVLQEDVFRLKNKLITIRVVKDGTPMLWTAGDIAVCQWAGRFVLIHRRDATGDFFYKDPVGDEMPPEIRAYLPTGAQVISNAVNDCRLGAYDHLMTLRNMKIIVTAPTTMGEFETWNGFTKPAAIPAFRKELEQALTSLQFTERVETKLKRIEGNEPFKCELRMFIDHCNAMFEVRALSDKYQKLLEASSREYETKGTRMDQGKIEATRRELDEAIKENNFGANVPSNVKEDEKNMNHKLAQQFPEETKCFQEVATLLNGYDPNQSIIDMVKRISERLGIEEAKLTKFFEAKKKEDADCHKVPSSKPEGEVKDSIMEDLKHAAQVKVTIDHHILPLDNLLAEIQQRNQLTNKDIADIKSLYQLTMNHFKNSWEGKSAKDISAWAKSKRGSVRDFTEVVAACIRAHQIVSKGEVTLRDVQIIAILMFLGKSKANFAEISTGEGKTIIISVLAVALVMRGKRVDIVTSNEVLADDGLNEMRTFYYLFGVLASSNNFDSGYKKGVRSCYTFDVVYGTIGNFQFDYLRDTFEGLGTRGNRPFEFLILDEVDSLIIDNGTYIAKLAQPFPGVEYLRYVYIKIWLELQKAEKHLMEEIDDALGKVANDTTMGDQEKDREYSTKYDKYLEDSQKIMKDYIKQNVKLDAIPIPKHLRGYCADMMDKWCENALFAKYGCHENEAYVLKMIKQKKEDGSKVTSMRVVPVDYANTGVTLLNTVWSNGLHQFVQLKHNLQLTCESLTASFISNLAYIKLYGNNLYGMTGTLGSISEQKFLSDHYDLAYMRLPTYKAKSFRELQGIVVRDSAWASCVIMETYVMVKQSRAVLIICETINDVRILKGELEALKQIEDASWIQTRYYETEEDVTIIKDKMRPFEVMIATNIAGRGTNIKTTDRLEQAGGLHVCVTFLPCNERVEKQAFGRTSRQGKLGTARLICRESHVHAMGYTITEESTMEDIKEHRDATELLRLQEMRKGKIKEVLFNDQLFGEFAKTYTEFYNKQKELNGGIYVCMDLKEAWAFWLRRKQFTGTEVVDVVYPQFLEEVKAILEGKISFNPYYALKQADSFMKKEEYDAAKNAINNAISLEPDLNYAANMKLFEWAILSGKALLNRFYNILRRIIFVPAKETQENIGMAKTALQQAFDNYEVELKYIRNELIENKEIGTILVENVDAAGNAKQEDFAKNNLFFKHLLSRYYALLTHQRHASDLLEQLRGGGTFWMFNGKMEDYLEKLNPSVEGEKELKEHLENDELVELRNASTSTIYRLKQVYEPTNLEIHVAQGQILAGIGVFLGCLIFPPALAIGGPIAGALIGEGISDIVLMMVNKGETDFDMQAYVQSKCVSYLISIITVGFSIIARCTSILQTVMKACNGVAKFLKGSKILSMTFGRMATALSKVIAKSLAFTQRTAGLMLTRSVAAKIALQHIGISVGINLTGALVSEFVVSKILIEILKNSRGAILASVEKLVNEKFATNLKQVSRETLTELLAALSAGTVGQLSWEILKNVVVGLMAGARSWKCKLIGISLYALTNGTEIGIYSNQYCNEVIGQMKTSSNVQNSEQVQTQLRSMIAETITNDVYRKLMLLATTVTHTLMVNPLMMKAIRKTMKKFHPEGASSKAEADKTFKEIADAHRILGLSEGASPEEIRKAYRTLAYKYHPDSRKEPSSERFIAVNNAYQLLLEVHRNETLKPPTSGSKSAPAALPSSEIQFPMAHEGNIKTLSRKLGEYIVIKDESTGKTSHFGSDYGGKPLEVMYRPPKNGKSGHYYIAGKENQIVPTAKNLCLYDAIELARSMRPGITKFNSTELSIMATSFSFDNMIYNGVVNVSQVFNNKLTQSWYQKIQASILVGGMAVTELRGDNYPSGVIQIKKSTDFNPLIDLQNEMRTIYEDAEKANITVTLASAQGQLNQLQVPRNVNSNRLPIMAFVPKKSRLRKKEIMLGTMKVQFDGDPRVLQRLIGHEDTLKIAAISGETPFSNALVPDPNGPHEYAGQRYSLQPLTYSKDGYRLLQKGRVQLDQVYDIFDHRVKPLAPGEGSTCAAIKLATEVGEIMKAYKAETGIDLHVKGDIEMVEGYFKARDPAWKDPSDVFVAASCAQCQRFLPAILGNN